MDSPVVKTPEGKSPRLLPPITNGDGLTVPGDGNKTSQPSPGSVHLSPCLSGTKSKMWCRNYGSCFGGSESSSRVSDEEVADMCSFLDRNRDLLQTYVVESVPLEELETWFFKKLRSLHVEERSHRKKLAKFRDRFFYRSPFAILLRTLHDNLSENAVVWELAKTITTSVGVDAYRIYKMNPDLPGFVQSFPIGQKKLDQKTFQHMEQADPDQIILALEAAKKKICVRVMRNEDPLRFPSTPTGLFKEFKVKGTRHAGHILYMPIFNSDAKTGYIIEMWRVKERFKEKDEDMCSYYMVWGSMCVHFCSLYLDKKRERNMTDFLLDVVKAIFEEMVSLDQLIKRILEFAQRLVNADRASLFLVDTINNELVSTVFDLRFEAGNNTDVEKKEIRMPINRGIAGHVATSGDTMNIPDAYADSRFNREVDEATGYKTVSILCMPVKVEGKIIGVVQMVNKREENCFGHEDEVSFETFSTFFGLALHNAKLYDRIIRNEQKYRVALEVLSYHNTCKENEVEELVNDDEYICTELNDFSLDPYKFNEFQKCKLAITMFDHLFIMKNFNKTVLTRFVLTVKKNYRTVPYHNFDHGWSVAHAMYVILRNDIDNKFDYTRRLALFVASLCHDLDHRGYTNKYMSETASPLAAMYTTSTLEHHHFNITVTILQQDGHNIFSQITSQQYKEILGYIRQAILATDLAAFFPNLDKIKNLLDRNSHQMFDWEIPTHMDLGMAISMTAADLSASSKPWRVQLKTVKVIFEEFYAQGDKEKAQGKTPIPMMDRNKPEEQPASQVGFLSQICIPCYTMLYEILPYTYPMIQMVQLNLNYWSQRAKQALKDKKSQETIAANENTKANDNATSFATMATNAIISSKETITVIEPVISISTKATFKTLNYYEPLTANKTINNSPLETKMENEPITAHEKINDHKTVNTFQTKVANTTTSANESIIGHETATTNEIITDREIDTAIETISANQCLPEHENFTTIETIIVHEAVDNAVAGPSTEVTRPPKNVAMALDEEAFIYRSQEECKYGAIKKRPLKEKKPKIIHKMSWEEEDKPLPDAMPIGKLYQDFCREGDNWIDEEGVVIQSRPPRNE